MLLKFREKAFTAIAIVMMVCASVFAQVEATYDGIALESDVMNTDDTLKFVISTPEAAQIKLVILDNLGNVVNSQELKTNSDGNALGAWDLKNSAGRFVSVGMYKIVVEARGVSGKIYNYNTIFGVRN